MTQGRKALSWLVPVRQSLGRLRHSEDREHEILANRIAIGTLVALYALAVIPTGPDAWRMRLLSLAYFAASVALMVHPLLRPGPSQVRRLVAVLADVGFLSAGFYMGGAVASPLFPVYLWIVLGNGFRFGLAWLRIAAAVSAAGFALVVVATPYWQDNLSLGLGLLVGLVVIPLYAGRLIRTLSDAKRAAEAASEAKSLFLASVSHELRTPLNAVIGMSALIASTQLSGEQREMAGTIEGASKSLLSLIDGILDLSRIEAGRMTVAHEPFDLVELLGGVMDIVSVKSREKGLRTALHVTSRTPADMVGDARHLREILLNLVSNAVKFTPSGSVTLAADAARTPEGGCTLHIEVSDTGIGIAADAQARIFEDFVQADASIIDRFGGTGLGLAITSRLAHLLGGSIRVASAEGRGSVFTLSIPVVAAAPAPARLDGIDVLPLGVPGTLAPVLERLRGLGCRILTGAGADLPPSGRRLIRLAASPADGPFDGSPAVLLGAPLVGVRPFGVSGAELPMAELRLAYASVVAPDASDSELAAALRAASGRREMAGREDLALWQRARPLQVLIADDNAVNTRVLEMVLDRAGHTATVVRNGELALDAMQASRFDVVLMDLNMPVMNGIDAVKLYRFTALGEPHVPILGLTADVTNAVQQRCRDAGMDGCLLKPIEPGTLLDALDAAAGAGMQPLPEVVPQFVPRSLPRSVPQHASGPRPAEAADAPVTDIASHPRFRAGGGPAVNPATVAQLRDLGGDAFLAGLITDFQADAVRVQAALTAAVHGNDMAAVLAEAHALHSAAGNMGAEQLRHLCRAFQSMSHADLAGAGRSLLRDLATELARVNATLGSMRTDPGPGLARTGGAELGKAVPLLR